MGLIFPSQRGPDTSSADRAEIERLEKAAQLPVSQVANLMRIFGFIFLTLSALSFLLSPIAGIGGLIGSIFIIAMSQLQQWVFDLRTLALRADLSRKSVNKGVIDA